jgi:hypothetical protein
MAEELPFNYYPKKKTAVFWVTFQGPLTPRIIGELGKKKVKTVQFGRDFNASIDDIPDGIVSIDLYYRFQQPITKLPSNLINFKLGSGYQHQINCWPPNIKTVYLCDNYHLIERLPPNLEKLIIDYSYTNQLLSPVPIMPLNLKFLGFTSVHINQLDIGLPPNLEVLQIERLYVNYIDEKLEEKQIPSTLTDIEVSKKLKFEIQSKEF